MSQYLKFCVLKAYKVYGNRTPSIHKFEHRCRWVGHLSTSLLGREINRIGIYQVTELVSVMTKREIPAAARKLNQSQIPIVYCFPGCFILFHWWNAANEVEEERYRAVNQADLPSCVVRYFRIQSPMLIWILNQSYSLAFTPLGTQFYWLWLCLILYNYRHSGRIKHIQMQANSSFS